MARRRLVGRPDASRRSIARPQRSSAVPAEQGQRTPASSPRNRPIGHATGTNRAPEAGRVRPGSWAAPVFPAGAGSLGRGHWVKGRETIACAAEGAFEAAAATGTPTQVVPARRLCVIWLWEPNDWTSRSSTADPRMIASALSWSASVTGTGRKILLTRPSPGLLRRGARSAGIRHRRRGWSVPR